MQQLDRWEHNFEGWMREKEDEEINSNIIEKNHKKLIEYEKFEVEEIEAAKKKDVFQISGLMNNRKMLILTGMLILLISFVVIMVALF